MQIHIRGTHAQTSRAHARARARSLGLDLHQNPITAHGRPKGDCEKRATDIEREKNSCVAFHACIVESFSPMYAISGSPTTSSIPMPVTTTVTQSTTVAARRKDRSVNQDVGEGS